MPITKADFLTPGAKSMEARKAFERKHGERMKLAGAGEGE
jgi:hypothetical protein